MSSKSVQILSVKADDKGFVLVARCFGLIAANVQGIDAGVDLR